MERGTFPLWPPQLSEHAAQVDLLLLLFTLLLFCLVVPIGFALVYFIIKYRAGSSADRRHNVTRSIRLEIAWAAIPFVLTLVFFVWAARLYFDLFNPPDDALEITVVAKQWMWKFQHPTGQREINVLHVPAGQPVVLSMISQDVIHSLFIPALRIKHDVLPNRYTQMWFEAQTPGEYLLECAEFCGTDHSAMDGRVVVMEPATYQRWLEESDVDLSLAARGAELFRSYGCSGCHTAGSVARAPRLEGVFGRPVPLAGGGTVIADEQYIRDSILLPNRQIVAGYEPIMPSFQGQIDEEDLISLVAYIRDLDWEAEDRVADEDPAEDGE
jgi:cytochrome c oxidase subunit 2